MKNATKNMLLPAFIGSAVLVIAFTLLTIVARSPYTHSNLNAGFDPSYTRTEQTFVGAPIPFTGGGLAVPRAGDPIELGRQLFVTNGCATCHGLDGRGGIVGPPIVGTKAEKLRTVTLVGPKGMPAYAPGALTDEDLATISTYLNSIGK
ncbi:MAG: cytochrome c [Chloroflexi bacterium]|nr:cytochrome c [Chloroflexota bacterium]